MELRRLIVDVDCHATGYARFGPSMTALLVELGDGRREKVCEMSPMHFVDHFGDDHIPTDTDIDAFAVNGTFVVHIHQGDEWYRRESDGAWSHVDSGDLAARCAAAPPACPRAHAGGEASGLVWELPWRLVTDEHLLVSARAKSGTQYEVARLVRGGSALASVFFGGCVVQMRDEKEHVTEIYVLPMGEQKFRRVTGEEAQRWLDDVSDRSVCDVLRP